MHLSVDGCAPVCGWVCTYLWMGVHLSVDGCVIIVIIYIYIYHDCKIYQVLHCGKSIAIHSCIDESLQSYCIGYTLRWLGVAIICLS